MLPPAKRPASRNAGNEQVGVRATRLAARLNAAPPVQGLMATAQTLRRHGGRQPQAGDNAAPARMAVAGGVVQAKLFRGRAEIDPPDEEAGASALVRSLIEEEREYVLRDGEPLTAESVHVLRRDRKYLLGEKHDESNWAARTERWDVDTMLESGKAFPEKRAPVDADAPTQRDQPLESIHAYLLAVLLQVQSWLNSWRSAWETALEDDAVIDDEELNRELAALGHDVGAEDELGVPDTGEGHQDAVDHQEEAHPDETGEDDAVSDAAPDNIQDALDLSGVAAHELRNQYRELTAVLRQYVALVNVDRSIIAITTFRTALPGFLGPVKDTITAVQAMMTLSPDTTREMARPLLDQINESPVKAFVAAVQTLIGETPDGADPDRIAAVADGAPLAPGHDGTSESLTLTDPYREAEMIRSINTARAPLLVKIGNNHVDRVGDAVAKAVKVPIATDFDAMTKKP
jgi:hypothetical protein